METLTECDPSIVHLEPDEWFLPSGGADFLKNAVRRKFAEIVQEYKNSDKKKN